VPVTPLPRSRGTRHTTPGRTGALRPNERPPQGPATVSNMASAANQGDAQNGAQNGTQTALSASPNPAPQSPNVVGAYLYTVADVMVLLRLSKTQVFDEIRRGRLMSVTVGRARRVPAQSLTDYVNLLIAESQERAA
jgi:hypothetical protein